MCVLLSLVLLMAVVPFGVAVYADWDKVIGDVTITVTPPAVGTGSTNAKSAISVTGAGTGEYYAWWQDHTGDGSIDADDLTKLSRYVAGIIDPLE